MDRNVLRSNVDPGPGWRARLVIAPLLALSGCATTKSYTNEPWIPDERIPGTWHPNPQVPVMNNPPPPAPNRP
jgi:hypothetical protein